MEKISGRFRSLAADARAVPLGLLAVAILAYGLMLPRMGFYWDDLPISWIRYQLGPQAMRQYFSTSRPVWGELYQLTTRLLPQVPIYWQIFALFWRWLGAVLVWAIFRELWPVRRGLALTVSLFFLLYPGFNQQWISFLYSHFFIVLACFLFSLLLMLWSLRRPDRYLPLTLAGMLFSGLNLWMMEYFFFLEMIRPFIIYACLAREEPGRPAPATRRLIPQALLKWLPYLAVWVADVLYRALVFTNLAYGNTLLADLRARPLAALLELANAVRSAVWQTSAGAWAQVLQVPTVAADGPRSVVLYALIVLGTGAIAAILLAAARHDEQATRRFALWPIGMGLLALLAAGGPYWVAKVDVVLGFPANRFTLSFMLGASLLLAGLLELAPRAARLALLAALVGLAAGRQASWAEAYAHDWALHKSLFWQMTWRAPGLAPDTIVLVNDGPLQYYADNSMGAALNWIYDPENRDRRIHYVFFYPTSRLGGSLPELEPETGVHYTFLIGSFIGNTSQTVAFYYDPPGCLRLLDPQIDPEDRRIPLTSLMRDAARLSSSEWIRAGPAAAMPRVYGAEPAHGWCYYFERADLARQSRDWPEVVALGEAAFALNDYPNDPLERFVFIEGYAHAGDWGRARQLSVDSYRVSPEYIGPLLCRLWDRIARETPESPEGETALSESRAKFECLP